MLTSWVLKNSIVIKYRIVREIQLKIEENNVQLSNIWNWKQRVSIFLFFFLLNNLCLASFVITFLLLLHYADLQKLSFCSNLSHLIIETVLYKSE